jgi:molybdate transport system substrate-binding protein
MALGRLAVAALLSMTVTAAQAAEIAVLATVAAKEALVEIVPLFERGTGHKIKISFDNGPPMVEKIMAGASADLFIGPDEFADRLLKEGKLVAGSRVDFAHSDAGVAVRAGAPRPDIDTADNFKNALLAAKTVSYSTGASGIQVVNVLARLVAPQRGELVGAVVARGAAEIGIHQFSELLPVTGIDIIGPLPRELQRVIVYSVSLMPMATQQDAGRAFVNFLRSPTSAPIIKRKGMDPV